MIEAVSTIPRIETQLYLDYQGQETYLQVFIYRNKSEKKNFTNDFRSLTSQMKLWKNTLKY